MLHCLIYFVRYTIPVNVVKMYVSTGISLGILKHVSGTPCLAPRNEKCAYGYLINELWSYKMLSGPVATSEIVLLYVPF